MTHIGSIVAEAIDDMDITGVTYNATTSGGTVFVDIMPPKPDIAVCVVGLGGSFEPAIGLDDERLEEVQIRVRGKHIGTVYAMAQAITDGLQGDRDGATWGTGGYTIISVNAGMPSSMGLDDNNRIEYVSRVSVRYCV